MPHNLSQTMNDRSTASALPQAIDVPKPSIFAAAVSFMDRDTFRMRNLLSLIADDLQHKGLSLSSLDITREDNSIVTSAKMGLFDQSGRETTLTLKTWPQAEYPTGRRFLISGEESKPDEKWKPVYHFDGGDETWQPSHWAKDPRQPFTFHDPVKNHGNGYQEAFEKVGSQAGLAQHLAQKILRGFIHDVDPEAYHANRRLESPSYDGRSRRYHFPKESPVWQI